MPAKIKHKGSASKTGRRFKKRTPGQKPACRRGKEGPPAPSVIGDSIYTVRFKERTGPEVFCAFEKVEGNEFEKMYHDLWKAWRNLQYRLTGERSKFNAASAGVSIPLHLHYILDDMRQLVPTEFEFNIEKDQKTDDYFFMIYRHCEYCRCWNYIEVGPALIKLRKENRSLHELFLSFLRLFNRHAADLWDSGLMGCSLDAMDDRVTQAENEWEHEQVEQYQNCIAEYQGLPSEYLSSIRKAKAYKADDLKKRAKRFKAGNPIANLIFQGADLFLEGNQIQQYRYWPGDEEDPFYLDLEGQFNIIWKEEDPLYREHCDYMDALANEGIQEPVLSIRLDAGTRNVDFTQLNLKSHWPDKLTDFMARARQLLNKFTDEQQN